MHIQPYLFFNGRAEEAAGFYQRVLAAEVMHLVRFSDSPQPPDPESVPAGSQDKVMHMCLRIGDSTVMGSDGCAAGEPDFKGFSITLTVDDEPEVERLFAALGDGGEVQMPLEKTFFSPRFGMVADRFGVSWMLLVEPDEPIAGA